MSLDPQTRIGPYEVIAKLGQGGMGEVYRARDARLDRDVAVKILPELFASDSERLARFDREAKTLAALSHPCARECVGKSRATPCRHYLSDRWSDHADRSIIVAA